MIVIATTAIVLLSLIGTYFAIDSIQDIMQARRERAIRDEIRREKIAEATHGPRYVVGYGAHVWQRLR